MYYIRIDSKVNIRKNIASNLESAKPHQHAYTLLPRNRKKTNFPRSSAIIATSLYIPQQYQSHTSRVIAQLKPLCVLHNKTSPPMTHQKPPIILSLSRPAAAAQLCTGPQVNLFFRIILQASLYSRPRSAVCKKKEGR